jgi:soluble lytic murein transglycosylase-like protein
MRLAVIALTLTCVASTVAQAQVHLTIRRDGSKVITNVATAVDPKNSDLSWLAKRHNRRSEYDEAIDRYARQYGVDPVLVRAVIQVESNFNPQCVSKKGARGLMQLMPATAKRFGVTRVHDPEENIKGGVRYLSFLRGLYRDDLQRILAAYNAGEGAVKRHGGVPPYRETMTYVKRALTVYFGTPYGSAVSFAGRRGGATLRGGLRKPMITASMLPGVKVLGSH